MKLLFDYHGLWELGLSLITRQFVGDEVSVGIENLSYRLKIIRERTYV